MSEISTKRNLTFVAFSDAKVDKSKAIHFYRTKSMQGYLLLWLNDEHLLDKSQKVHTRYQNGLYWFQEGQREAATHRLSHGHNYWDHHELRPIGQKIICTFNKYYKAAHVTWRWVPGKCLQSYRSTPPSWLTERVFRHYTCFSGHVPKTSSLSLM